jgi:uncharacterized protein (DUF2236 family)
MHESTPSPSAPEPDVGYFGPDSVAWRLHRDPALLVGGLRALLIQALEPRAMAGVAQFSQFREDPWGRLERTSAFVSTVVFGSRAEADALGARVRKIHGSVRGFDAFGRHYTADDPELLMWIHAVEVHSFVDAYRRFSAPLSNADADRYVDEMAISGELVGIEPAVLPRSMSDLREYFATVRGLAVTPEAIEGLKFIVAPPMPLALRPLWTVPVLGAFATLPRFARQMYNVPWPAVATPPLRASLWALGRIANRILPGPPAYRDAIARLSATPTA